MGLETFETRSGKAAADLPGPPSAGRAQEVAPGVRWIRMPLPFALDHINLWAIEDGGGWTVVDTGIRHAATIAAWERIFDDDFGGRPVTRILVTHQHADHAGLAGWIAERFGCRVSMTRTEYRAAATLAARTDPVATQEERDFYRRAGWRPDELQALASHRTGIARLYAPLPERYDRLHDGEELTIGERSWRVIAGGGHTPEHACFHCPELKLLISGDKVLPGISSNISVGSSQPEADPVGEWFATLGKLRRAVSDETLVLPSHKLCFRGLHARIDELFADQRDVLARLRQALATPKRIPDLFEFLFARPIDRSDIPLFSLATGEAIALLNHLAAAGTIERQTADGVDQYREKFDASRS